MVLQNIVPASVPSLFGKRKKLLREDESVTHRLRRERGKLFGLFILLLLNLNRWDFMLLLPGKQLLGHTGINVTHQGQEEHRSGLKCIRLGLWAEIRASLDQTMMRLSSPTSRP